MAELNPDVVGRGSWKWIQVGSTDTFQGEERDIIDLIYPVGAIYMSTNNVDPSLIFGGTWEQIEDRFLLASGTDYPLKKTVNNEEVQNTGGSADAVVVTHNHTQNSHNHTQNPHYHGTGNNTSNMFLIGSVSLSRNTYKRQPPQADNGHYFPYVDVAQPNFGAITSTSQTTAINNGTVATNNPSGESGEGKNMPPYIVVNVWHRIA